jgi:hypothetical protein
MWAEKPLFYGEQYVSAKNYFVSPFQNSGGISVWFDDIVRVSGNGTGCE